MAGIVQSKEVIAAFKALADALVDSKADGKIDFYDLPKFIKVIRAFRDAVDAAEEVPSELKDLTADEMNELLVDAVAAIMSFGKIVLPLAVL